MNCISVFRTKKHVALVQRPFQSYQHSLPKFCHVGDAQVYWVFLIEDLQTEPQPSARSDANFKATVLIPSNLPLAPSIQMFYFTSYSVEPLDSVLVAT